MTPTGHDSKEPIVIALVNNMPDAALERTEQQFSSALSAAAGAQYDIRLRRFSFPELIRGDAGRAYVADHYEQIDQLWTGSFDGLVVTGAEPRTAAIPDEVYWPSLARLVELANEGGTPTVFSCLAAHAAVLYLDGIERQPVGEKLSGVFRCTKSSGCQLMEGLPSSWRVPHSRLNTLDSAQLIAAGYEIASFSEEAGVDTFLLRRRALFVFFQGHPEYDSGALFREYRRDVGRFLSGTTARYPAMPRGYFDDDTASALIAFRTRAHRQRTRALLEEFPASDATERLAPAWNDVAVRFYRNWLDAVVGERGADALLVGDGATPPAT